MGNQQKNEEKNGTKNGKKIEEKNGKKNEEKNEDVHMKTKKDNSIRVGNDDFRFVVERAKKQAVLSDDPRAILYAILHDYLQSDNAYYISYKELTSSQKRKVINDKKKEFFCDMDISFRRHSEGLEDLTNDEIEELNDIFEVIKEKVFSLRLEVALRNRYDIMKECVKKENHLVNDKYGRAGKHKRNKYDFNF